tara:strand:+ start:213 stop:485 length:273 start_codon:yes stop_codon:yes gene_type:complete
MPIENKLNHIKINEPYKIITIACDVITKNDEGVITETKRVRETFCPTDVITNRLNALSLSDDDEKVITDATSNWTDEIKTAYTTYMNSLK